MVHRCGFLFENKKRRDNTIIVYGKELVVATQPNNCGQADHCTAEAVRASYRSLQKFFSVLPGSEQRPLLGMDLPDEVNGVLGKTLEAQTLVNPQTPPAPKSGLKCEDPASDSGP